MWNIMIEPYHVSVLRIGVRDSGRAEWSRRRSTGLAFVRVSTFLTLHGHLTLAMTSHSSPRGVGSWAIESVPGL
jgi:hypothetical protein